MRRVADAISGRDEAGSETSPDAKLLRAFDLAGVAVSAPPGRPLRCSSTTSVGDDDTCASSGTSSSVRASRSSCSGGPAGQFAVVTEAVNFVADMERMGLSGDCGPAGSERSRPRSS